MDPMDLSSSSLFGDAFTPFNSGGTPFNSGGTTPFNSGGPFVVSSEKPGSKELPSELQPIDARTAVFSPPATSPFDKNIATPQMDSTPIGAEIDYGTPQAGFADPSQYMPQAAPAPKKGPMNLTPEQIDALVAGVAAVIGFAGPVQEKLHQFVPQATGNSAIGMALTALIVALIFYFGRRFVNK